MSIPCMCCAPWVQAAVAASTLQPGEEVRMRLVYDGRSRCVLLGCAWAPAAHEACIPACLPAPQPCVCLVLCAWWAALRC